MRWIKYCSIALLTLVLFCGGGAFYWLLNQSLFQKETLSIKQNLQAKTSLPSSLFSTTISLGFNTQEINHEVQTIYQNLLEAIQQNTSCHLTNHATDSKDLINFECLIAHDHFKDFQSFFKGLKTHPQITLKHSHFLPFLTPKQKQEALNNLTQEILKQAQEINQSYAIQLNKTCIMQDLSFDPLKYDGTLHAKVQFQCY